MVELVDLKDGWFDLVGRIQVQVIEKGQYFEHCDECILSLDSGRLRCGNCGTIYRMRGLEAEK